MDKNGGATLTRHASFDGGKVGGKLQREEERNLDKADLMFSLGFKRNESRTRTWKMESVWIRENIKRNGNA